MSINVGLNALWHNIWILKYLLVDKHCKFVTSARVLACGHVKCCKIRTVIVSAHVNRMLWPYNVRWLSLHEFQCMVFSLYAVVDRVFKIFLNLFFLILCICIFSIKDAAVDLQRSEWKLHMCRMLKSDCC